MFTIIVLKDGQSYMCGHGMAPAHDTIEPMILICAGKEIKNFEVLYYLLEYSTATSLQAYKPTREIKCVRACSLHCKLITDIFRL